MPKKLIVRLAALTVIGAAALAPTAVMAQYPPHAWDYPFCGSQPHITALYDHEYPTYDSAPNKQPGPYSRLRVYNNTVDDREYEGHNGWDYRTREGSANVKQRVYAVSDGVVSYAGWHKVGNPSAGGCYEQVAAHESMYGLMLRVRHGDYEVLYGHLSAILVEEGQTVSRNQIIATTGDTGNSTGPHLHYGAFEPGGPIIWYSFDPYGWNRDWRGLQHLPISRNLDPWYLYTKHESVRMMLPGAHDNDACPTACGRAVVVDDSSTGFSLGCDSPPCNHWHEANVGIGGHMWYTHPNGRTADHWATWTAPLPGGDYEVEAYVPASRTYATTHAARYAIGTRTAVVDQHEEGNVWVKLGIYHFHSAPSVTLTDASYIAGNWCYAGDCRTVGADAVRFTPICGLEGGPIPVASDQPGTVR